jgi:hypothetical protein
MSGESQRDDDSLDDDFLGDDFVIEDLGAKNEDLEGLFDAQNAKAEKKPGEAPDDSEDVLFQPTQPGSGEVTFGGGPEFAESAPSNWTGDGLELGEDSPVGAEGKGMAAAEASFTKELDSLLQAEDDFALDSEQDLELVGDGAARGGEQAGSASEDEAFVLDDGEGQWQEQESEVASEEEHLELPLAEAASEEVDQVEPGWEPLPATNVDDLSEVGEVARAEGETEVTEEPVAESYEAAEEAEGHDLYMEAEEVAEPVGAPVRRGRGLRLVASLAASLTVLAAGAVVVLRPDWIGLGGEPERVQQVEVQRPNVVVAVPTPEAPKPPEVVTPPPDVDPTPVEPPPVPADPAPTDPSPPADPVPQSGGEPVPVPVPSPGGANAWPVPETGTRPAPADPAAPRSTTPNLVRVNEELMIGDEVGVADRQGASGILPGSRAFAQLHNGNFFIGSVKSASADRITLRVEKGEVTLQVEAIAKLTELGSADYEDLQRVTSGFIRLTNNNRLVGGILSGIADDHVVLEFRKNRVMLPKSLVGEVVQGEAESEIRLDTTLEEDDWLRRLAERQIGTGVNPAPTPAPGAGGSTPR